ncbi:hypothetical protein B296_00010243 [Ensete ventricosum]|uniref:Uncharacterized protein n=1 Tax=Ensete ventricosum TaxID=4639 RepID=A0A427ANT7_ENSVE|nr:hypothetical protein B296_00010243 [Ensete ventricosum]
MILSLENQDLSLLDICPVGATFLFAFFSLKVSEATIPLDYSVLLYNLCMVLPPQMHLLEYDSSLIQPQAAPFKEFTRRFTEGIEKLAGNTLGICREITGEKTRRLTVSMPEAAGLAKVVLI